MMDLSAFNLGLATPDFFLLALVFGAAFFVAIGMTMLFTTRGDVARRLSGQDGQGVDDERRTMFLQGSTTAEKLLGPLRKYLIPLNADKMSGIRKSLTHAGFGNPSAIRTYFAVRAILGILFAVALGSLLPLMSKAISIEHLIPISAVVALCGFYLPTIFLMLRTRRRQAACRDGFPDALDMLLICVEAGLGMDAAINRVSVEIQRAHPILSQHFEMMGFELRAGKTREDALRNLSVRIGIDEVSSLVTLLLQSEQLGTSIAQSLRVYSAEMRARRLLRAEETAGKLPVKLSVPLILFILPALMIVVMAPAMIKVMRNMLPAMGAG